MNNKTNNKQLVFSIVLFITIAIMCLFAGAPKNNEIQAFADSEIFTSSPVITILHHGLGGSPLDWINNNTFVNSYLSTTHFTSSSFTYRSDSLIECLRKKQNNAKVYVVTEIHLLS